MIGTGAFRWWAILTLASGMASLAGCGAPAWKVVRDTPGTSQLRGAGPVTVSFDYSRLDIGGKSEQEWVESKLVEDPTYGQSWAKLKSSFESSFLSGFGQGWAPGAQLGPPGQQGVHLFVIPVSMTIGHYMVFVASATSVDAALDFTVNGQGAEEIEIRAAEWASIYKPSVFQHMPGVAGFIGENAGRFVASKN